MIVGLAINTWNFGPRYMIFFVRLKFHSTLDYLFWLISQEADIRSWLSSNLKEVGRLRESPSMQMANIAAFYKVSHTQMREADMYIVFLTLFLTCFKKHRMRQILISLLDQ